MRIKNKHYYFIKKMYNRIVEIVHKNKIGHLGSCLTALPILEHI